MCLFVVVNADENCSVLCEKLMEQPQTRIHHAEPFVMTGEVFPFFPDNFTEPFFYFRIVDVIIIDPLFIAGIVGWIDVDTFYSAFVFGEERLESIKVIAVNNFIPAWGSTVVGIFLVQNPVGDILMMIDDFGFSDPLQSRHEVILEGGSYNR